MQTIFNRLMIKYVRVRMFWRSYLLIYTHICYVDLFLFAFFAFFIISYVRAIKCLLLLPAGTYTCIQDIAFFITILFLLHNHASKYTPNKLYHTLKVSE